MTNIPPMLSRAGYSDAAHGAERTHTLIVLVEDHPGSVDRVIGALRRKRAGAQALSMVPSETPNVVRISAQVKDTNVSVDNLVEQLRKIVDVQRVTNITAQQTITRELALIKVNTTPATVQEAIEVGKQFGGSVIDTTADILTFEVTGSAEQLTQAISAFQAYGIREIARSGRITLARGTDGI